MNIHWGFKQNKFNLNWNARFAQFAIKTRWKNIKTDDKVRQTHDWSLWKYESKRRCARDSAAPSGDRCTYVCVCDMIWATIGRRHLYVCEWERRAVSQHCAIGFVWKTCCNRHIAAVSIFHHIIRHECLWCVTVWKVPVGIFAIVLENLYERAPLKVGT